MKLNSMVQISLLLFSSIWIISSCGVSPGPYIPVAGGPVPAATSEPSGTTGTAPGTKPATTGTKPATGTTPGAKPAVTPPQPLRQHQRHRRVLPWFNRGLLFSTQNALPVMGQLLKKLMILASTSRPLPNFRPRKLANLSPTKLWYGR